MPVDPSEVYGKCEFKLILSFQIIGKNHYCGSKLFRMVIRLSSPTNSLSVCYKGHIKKIDLKEETQIEICLTQTINK